MPGVVVAQTNMFMCSDPGQELIHEDLKRGINRVVVASCAPSLHETTFRNALTRAGMNPYLYEHANIREQVSWVHHGEAATEKASRLVAAAVAKAARLNPLEPHPGRGQRHATVIGGGIAGLKAAKDLAERGIAVVLLEKSPFLGGRMAQLDSAWRPRAKAPPTLISGLAGAVLNHGHDGPHLCQVGGFEGYVGNFSLTVVTTPPEFPAEADRAGIEPVREGPGRLMSPWWGSLPAAIPEAGRVHPGNRGHRAGHRVSDLPTPTGGIRLRGISRSGHPAGTDSTYGRGPRRAATPWSINGRPIQRLALIHCVGSRQIPGIHEEDEGGHLNEYCSRTCCSATLQAAILIRESYPRDPGLRLLPGHPHLRPRAGGTLYPGGPKPGAVFPFRGRAGAPRSEKSPPDRPPLAGPGEGHPDLRRGTGRAGGPGGAGGGQEPNDIADLVEMMKLPVGADRFLLEVHPKLRPVELSMTGILLAGTCQAPIDVGETCAAAGAAAVKAAAILTRGYVELDPFVAGGGPQQVHRHRRLC